MIDFLTYDLKVAVLIAVFYMFYRLLLSKETFHQVNRFVLLATAVASFVLPLCVITMHETVVAESPMVTIGELNAVAITEEPSVPSWQMVLTILFIIGMVATLAHTFLSVWKVIRIIRNSEQHPQPDDTIICVTGNAALAPFSWMHYIVMNRNDHDISNPAILTHERGHIRLHHSYDLLLVDLLTALQWFNPAIWMLRADLRAIHEYEADGAVLSQGINARQYQYLLITKAGSIGGYSIANGINHSTLKNRITMMQNKSAHYSHLLKLLALLPIVGTALALNAETVTDYVYQQPQKKVIKKGKKNATINKGSANEIVVVEQGPDAQKGVKPVEMPNAMKVKKLEKEAFDVVEQMPQFPGGQAALMEYLTKSVKYPKECEKKSIQGRVIASFVVEEDGSITNASVAKSVDPLLDAEALRVINAMPNWTPGMQKGEAVRVKYTLPFTFRLDGKKTAKARTYVLEVDGKIVDNSELDNIPNENIERIDIFKDVEGQPDKIRITTKKKE